MFSVIFDVHPKPQQWDAYLGNAKMLRPELEQIDGFIDNVRYKSLTREGWILSQHSRAETQILQQHIQYRQPSALANHLFRLLDPAEPVWDSEAVLHKRSPGGSGAI